MLAITQKAELTLLKDLKIYWKEFPGHRCLQLKFSLLDGEEPYKFSDLSGCIRTYIGDESLRVYVCQDSDIFILARSLTKKSANELLVNLSSKLALPSLKGAASLFEIGVDWSRLKTICTAKLDTIKLLDYRASKKKEVVLGKVTKEKMLETLDLDLLSSLAMRREARDKPEIMVVEDDPFSQKLIGNALKNKYSLSITGDGQGALMNYVNKAPDVLFLDIGLPDIDGHEVLEILFKMDPDAYVIMFSGNGDRENVMKAMSFGAKGFVGKPFTQEKLLQYIQKSPFIQSKKTQGERP